MSVEVVFHQPSAASPPLPPILRNPAHTYERQVPTTLLPVFSARPTIRTITVCRCGEFRHRTYRKLAQCAFPRSGAEGEGEYAIVRRCWRNRSAVVCVPDRAVAERALRLMANAGCWARCRGHHELVRLVLEAPDA